MVNQEPVCSNADEGIEIEPKKLYAYGESRMAVVRQGGLQSNVGCLIGGYLQTSYESNEIARITYSLKVIY